MASAEPQHIRIEEVRTFWEAHPVAAAAVPFPLGSREYFTYYDRLREANESRAFSYALHEYTRFAGKKVLDVGSGNGYVSSLYAAEGAETVGLDLTRTGIDLCRKRFEYRQLPGQFVVGNAEELPFADEAFDCVCSMGVLHHTPDTQRAVDEICRVMKPGGRLIVMVYHRNSALHRVRFPIDRLLRGRSVPRSVREVDGVGNPKGDVYTAAELRRLLAGFERLEVFADLLTGGMVLPGIGKYLPRALFQPFKSTWGWFLYAKGYKPARRDGRPRTAGRDAGPTKTPAQIDRRGPEL